MAISVEECAAWEVEGALLAGAMIVKPTIGTVTFRVKRNWGPDDELIVDGAAGDSAKLAGFLARWDEWVTERRECWYGPNQEKELLSGPTEERYEYFIHRLLTFGALNTDAAEPLQRADDWWSNHYDSTEWVDPV